MNPNKATFTINFLTKYISLVKKKIKDMQQREKSLPGNEEFTPEFFDEAQRAFRKNKIKLQYGFFKYRRMSKSDRLRQDVEQYAVPSAIRISFLYT